MEKTMQNSKVVKYIIPLFFGGSNAGNGSDSDHGARETLHPGGLRAPGAGALGERRAREGADKRPAPRGAGSGRPDRIETRGTCGKKGVCRRRPGFPIDRFSEVVRAWDGLTVVCIATGPSLTREQVGAVEAARASQEIRVIAINDAYLWAPFADLHYFADSRWWKWHKDRPEFQAFGGERVTIGPTGMEIDDGAVHMLRNGDEAGRENPGLSLDATTLLSGRNSGYQALNLAVLAGAARVALLGYDMRFLGGKQHFFGTHPIPNAETDFQGFAKNYRTLVEPLKKLGVEVLNCSPVSAIECFRKVTIEAALA